MEMIEAVRDEETVHGVYEMTTDTDDPDCVPDCVGCLTERIADAVTRAVLNTS
jgi:hypothetical protein